MNAHRQHPSVDGEPDVIIVGGAIAGGALANALGSRGIPTLLVEKVSREVHSTRGDLMHPPTLRILDGWGVLDALHRDGALPITELAVSAADRGLVARFPIDAAGPGAAGRTIAVPHDRIETVLFTCAAAWPSVRTVRGVVAGLTRDARGRVSGVRYRPSDSGDEVEVRARLVVGCDGSRSLVRRSLGIAVDEVQYEHEQVIIAGSGPTELPAALHWYLDEIGALCVVNRPRDASRILLTFKLGQRGDVLKRPDPALHEHVAARFPALDPLRFGKSDAYLYRLSRQIAQAFAAPGAALVGDAAHTTHPAGATGMSLAISGAARLAELACPALEGGSDDDLDATLMAYDAERRPAAALAVAANHAQAERLWGGDLHRDPDAYAAAVDPRAAWGAGGAGWGRDPAALALAGQERSRSAASRLHEVGGSR